MPRTLYDEDAKAIEVPTDEELGELKKQAEGSSEATKEVEKLKKQVDDLSADDGNRNWKQMRETMGRLKKALKDVGKEIDDDGNIIAKPQGVKQEEVAAMVAKATTEGIINHHISQKLAGFSEEQRKQVKAVYGKLSAGEDVTIENVDNFIGQAIRTVDVKPEQDPLKAAIAGGYSSGGPGGEGGNRQDFSETAEGKDLANRLGLPIEAPKDTK